MCLSQSLSSFECQCIILSGMHPVEALIAGHGMDEALERANTYSNAGADAILIHSPAFLTN